MRKDMRWHRAVVTEQHPPEVGTELLFDTGETDLLDLNTQRYSDRKGGYTRITRTVPRRGDNAEMAIIELV